MLRPRRGSNLRHGERREEPEFRFVFVGRIHRYFARDVWERDVAELPFWRAGLIRSARIAYLTLHGFTRDNCMFRASALTFTTVLSLVPLLAFAFSAAKGFGLFEKLRSDVIAPFIEQTFPPSEEGAGVRTAIDEILNFVESTNFTTLGTAGLLILMYTVIRLLGTIEGSFNEIWGVRRSRSFVRKVSDYLSMVTIAPIILVTATVIIGAQQSNQVMAFLREKLLLGDFIDFLLGFTRYFAMWIGFGFAYLAMPNTRTRLRSSVLGGVVAGSLWVGLQVVHVRFQIGMANYNAIYSSFAALPIFLVWLYACWVIVLFGAELAHAHQAEPEYRELILTRTSDHAFKELVALRAMTRIARTFLAGDPAMSPEDVAEKLGLPARSLDEVVERLVAHGLLAYSETDGGEVLLPARDLDLIRVKTILDALKGTTGLVEFPARDGADQHIDGVLVSLDREFEASASNKSLRELADEVRAENS